MKKSVEKKLVEWEKVGLIRQDQVAAISKYERDLPESHWVLSGLMILGVVVIGIGVISLIAANWSDIPNVAKLAVDFLMLGGIGFAIYRSSHSFGSGRSETAFNAWIVAMQIAALASIGLISQIYHTGGKLYQAILFWSLLVAPLSIIATKFFPPMLWMGGLLGAMTWSVVDSGLFTSFFMRNAGYVAYSLTMFCLMIAVIARLFSRGEEWPLSRVARFWTAYIGIGALLFLEFASRLREGSGFVPMYLGLAFLAIALGGVVLGGVYNRFQRISMMAMLFFFTALAHIQQIWTPTSSERGAEWLVRVGLVLFTLLSAGVFAASLRAQRTFQFVLAIIGMRLLGVYFEAFGGLAATGIGLIVSGGIVIGMGWLWNKYRKTIQVWVEELSR
jgi:uncharacterized membrane protein